MNDLMNSNPFTSIPGVVRIAPVKNMVCNGMCDSHWFALWPGLLVIRTSQMRNVTF